MLRRSEYMRLRKHVCGWEWEGEEEKERERERERERESERGRKWERMRS